MCVHLTAKVFARPQTDKTDNLIALKFRELTADRISLSIFAVLLITHLPISITDNEPTVVIRRSESVPRGSIIFARSPVNHPTYFPLFTNICLCQPRKTLDDIIVKNERGDNERCGRMSSKCDTDPSMHRPRRFLREFFVNQIVNKYA